MNSSQLDTQVVKQLDEEGPLSHDELCECLDVEWDELQQSIRRLRSGNKVAIRPDRRYELTTPPIRK